MRLEKILKLSTIQDMTPSRKTLLVIGDLFSFCLGFLLFVVIVFPYNQLHTQIAIHSLPFAVLTTIWIGVFFIFNFYEIQQSKPNMLFLRNFFIAAIICLGIGFIFFYVNPFTLITPKTNLFVFEILSLIIMITWRRIFYTLTMKNIHTRFAIVCNDERHLALVNEIVTNPHLGFSFQGTFLTMTEFINSRISVDLLIVHKTAAAESQDLEKVLGSCIDVIDLAEAYEMILYKIPIHFINSHWLIHSIKKQGKSFYNFLSRVISILFAIAVLIITCPISLIIIIAIKLEDGKQIFIKQERTSLNGKSFMLYKFRSMIVLGADGQAEAGQAIWSTGGKDPRITKVGTITRKLHIDEIPQMVNLLKGDMNLVGPRPERPDIIKRLEREIPYYFMRHTIKPGFTGWAQIKFRYARTILDSEEKFEYDLFYLKNRNIFLDFGIILKTAQIVFTHLE
jgi:lipopolysaccharide/colanic/teichoic acid biosynthesis glycosyltransferase